MPRAVVVWVEDETAKKMKRLARLGLGAVCLGAAGVAGCGGSSTETVGGLDCPAGQKDVVATTFDYVPSFKGSTTARGALGAFVKQHWPSLVHTEVVQGVRTKGQGETIRKFAYDLGASKVADVAVVDRGHGWLVGGYGACKSVVRRPIGNR